MSKSAIITRKFSGMIEPIIIHQPYLYFYGWELGAFISLLQDYHNDWETDRKYGQLLDELEPRISIGLLERQFSIGEFGSIELDGIMMYSPISINYLRIFRRLKRKGVIEHFYIKDGCVCFILNTKLLNEKIKEYFSLYDMGEPNYESKN
jgi:hypothetical protein